MPQMPEPQPKEWTVMFYFASDNPLAPSIVLQLKAIKDAGYHPEANIVAHFDPHTPNTPTHVFDVNHVDKHKARGGSKVGNANDPSVSSLVLDKVWSDKTDENETIRNQINKLIAASINGAGKRKLNGHGGNGDDADAAAAADAEKAAVGAEVPAAESGPAGQDAGDEVPDFGLPSLCKDDGLGDEAHPADSLRNFLRFCKRTYPARHYILFLLGHGLVVGNKMFMLDEHSARRKKREAEARGRGRATDGPGGAPVAETMNTSADDEVDVSSSLTLTELAAALSEFNCDAPTTCGVHARHAAKSDPPAECKPAACRLELIGFHSCSMSGLEVAYELQGKANYMMASQGPAFVGSWPYRHILIQLFNSLNATFRPEDLTNAPALMSRLKANADPVSVYVRGKLSRTANERLDNHDESRPPDPAEVEAFAKSLNRVLSDTGLCDAVGNAEGNGSLKMSEPAQRLFQRKRLGEADRRRLNRHLLAAAYPGALSANPATGDKYVEGLFKKFFDFIFANSADYQLAGYSFDLCLCDLRNVGGLTEKINKLAEALKAGLKGGPGLALDAEPLVREMILLAHWDAQSFWQDSYTDLYDFCKRLKRRCDHVFAWKSQEVMVKDKFKPLRDIITACEDVMWALTQEEREKPQGAPETEPGQGQEREPPSREERVIIRASFAGAEYQYSRGLSVYFPWSRPADDFFGKNNEDKGKYRQYKFCVDTTWDEFLNDYFDKTMRETFGTENPDARPATTPEEAKTQAQILESLLRDIGERVLIEGQLAKSSGNDATGKSSGSDASGDDCECSSVKNYPSITLADEHSPVRGGLGPYFTADGAGAE